MKAMTHKIEISDEAFQIIHQKTSILNEISPQMVIEWMILEFSPSKPEELIEQKKLRDKAYDNFRKKNLRPTLRKTWIDGYRCGWKIFQIRKSSSAYAKLMAKNFCRMENID